MLVHTFLAEAARRTPDATAIIEPGGRASYAELNRLANRYAHLFRSNDVACGDRVVIALDNSIDMVGAYMGALAAGAVAVPLPGGPKSDRLAAAIVDCAPTVCVIDAAAARAFSGNHPLAAVPTVHVAGASLQEALATCSDEAPSAAIAETDLAAIIYTSGSTGEPRGVMLSHRNFVSNAQSIVQYLELTAADRVMCVLPFSYVYGLSLLHTHLAVGGSIVIDNRFVFPNVVLTAMQEHRVTGFAGVPSTFALLLHRSVLEEVELPHLRYVTQAGGGMPPARITEWLERGPRAAFYVMYGATEAAARLTYLPPEDLPRKLGSIGRAIPNVVIDVINDAGEVARIGEIGELVARGPNISSGYWNRPEETAQKFGALGYRTGDLGYRDADGYLFLVGRLHDIIKVGAHRVGAKEIEDVLSEHPSVLDAAVVAAPHDLLGEVPVAFVALREALAEAEPSLRAFCAARLAAPKVPARVVVQADLPKLAAAGKIDKASLRERARDNYSVVTR
jgi:amino acid adenylation domain-containing protein